MAGLAAAPALRADGCAVIGLAGRGRIGGRVKTSHTL
ncbi:MAG: hypothetical protein H7338_19145 [Candidatus Sericytochromatia bacterium]|nr:hypothetical protein [Candidatus Sericytochromatia bacterium]